MKSTSSPSSSSMQIIYVDQDGIKRSLQWRTKTEENGAYFQAKFQNVLRFEELESG